MGRSVAAKIIDAHLVSGSAVAGQEIGLTMDQTLTQDSTGTMVYLEFEALGLDRVRTDLSLSFVDHNILQTGFENADDHRFLQSAAARYGLTFSRPGNGICHQVCLERFAAPGKTLIGADSHTPNAGGVGTLAIGAGGLDVAVAMAGEPFYLRMPEVTLVQLHGELQPWVAAKDVILELLQRLSVKGGVGKVIEYGGPGVATLNVMQRATITNMGTELGATTSIFPSDKVTRDFLRAQGRESDWREIVADPDAEYVEVIDLDLGEIEPLVACPSMPDNVKSIRDVAGTPLAQICIGSCTNSSLPDLLTVAAMLRGKTVHPGVSLTVSPGTKQVYAMIARSGDLADMIAAGARILESACGPCIGMGQSPATGVASLRSFNRNFAGRSGTRPDHVYLASPEVCAASALAGELADPRGLGTPPAIEIPEVFVTSDNMIIPPLPEGAERPELVRGPNIAPFPEQHAPADAISGELLLKVGDNITTDHISPAGAKYLPLRSNIPALSEHVFEGVDPTFATRSLDAGGGFIVGGENYGQGSSREHAALSPMFLGIKAVITKSYARIHAANLANFGILPLLFADASDYEAIEQGDVLAIDGIHAALEAGEPLTVRNTTQGTEFKAIYELSERLIAVILAGGLLNYTKQALAGAA